MFHKLSERDTYAAKCALRTVQSELLLAYLVALICLLIAAGAMVLCAVK